jgi:hypothetical protein
MQFDASTPRQETTIKGKVYLCPMPYIAGHVCNENEAKVLNQTLAENLRNNLVGKWTTKEGETETFTHGSQEDYDAYAAEYEFNVRGGGGGSSEARLTPVEREARRIARDKLDAALKAKGITFNKKVEAEKEKYENLLSNLAKREDIVKEAEKRMRSLDKIALEEINLEQLAA